MTEVVGHLVNVTIGNTTLSYVQLDPPQVQFSVAHEIAKGNPVFIAALIIIVLSPMILINLIPYAVKKGWIKL